MKMETRNGRLILIPDREGELEALDNLFGNKVNKDDTIGEPKIAKYRISDGYGEAYVSIES